MENTDIYGNPYLIDERQALKYLPHSIGIEIECGYNKSIDLNIIKEEWSKLPIMEKNSPNDGENKFRIDNGKNGLIGLFEVSNYCKQYLLLNEGSGIHYHVDAPWVGKIEKINHEPKGLNDFVRDFILKELDSWNYKGTYNIRNISYDTKGHWVNMRSDFGTVEYRIGEMTFDYPLLLKRILHISKLTEYLRLGFGKVQNSFLQKLLDEYEKDSSDETIPNLNQIIVKNTLKNRYVRS